MMHKFIIEESGMTLTRRRYREMIDWLVENSQNRIRVGKTPGPFLLVGGAELFTILEMPLSKISWAARTFEHGLREFHFESLDDLALFRLVWVA